MPMRLPGASALTRSLIGRAWIDFAGQIILSATAAASLLRRGGGCCSITSSATLPPPTSRFRRLARHRRGRDDSWLLGRRRRGGLRGVLLSKELIIVGRCRDIIVDRHLGIGSSRLTRHPILHPEADQGLLQRAHL